jgi:hypothetical protein
VISVVAATGPAWAQAALDEGQPATTEGEAQPAAATTDPAAPDPAATTVEDPDKVIRYGVGLRLRSVRIPKGLLELFVENSAGGSSNVGLGVELIRRRGSVEIQLGMEFEHLSVGEGPWIKKGDNVAAGDEADFILAPEHAPGGESLGWFTIEFTFLNHAEINKYVAVRYGGGAGLGILTGALYRYDTVCVGATNNNPDPGCRPANFTPNPGTGVGTGPVKYDLPPVFPVVNAIIGVQITPIKNLLINVEGGIRTVPFLGISTAYLF